MIKHPEPINTAGGTGPYHSCNGDVEYNLSTPDLRPDMSDSKADLRSRSESPRRARAARDRYWSYRHVHPDSQRSKLHLDLRPPTEQEGNERNWPAHRPVLPSEAAVVMPSKRQLFKQAQEWPRPPRRHHAARFRRAGMDSPRRKEELPLAGASDAWAPGKHGVRRKSRREGAEYTDRRAVNADRPDDGYASLSEARQRSGLVDLDLYEAGVVEELQGGGWQSGGCVGGEVDERAYDGDGVAHTSFEHHGRDVDALFCVAAQKYVLGLAAKRKKLQRQGWDVWEGEDAMSPEAEADWIEVDGEVGEWEWELELSVRD